MDVVLKHPVFLQDLANFQRWVLSEAKRFVREVVPPRIMAFVKVERARYQGQEALDDFRAKSSIALQLANPQHPFIQRLPDYPHDGPQIEWELSEELTQYQVERPMREYVRRQAVPEVPLSDLAVPDPEKDRKIQERYAALRKQAVSHALRHYGPAFEKRPQRRAATALLISFHPMAALIFNDAQLQRRLAEALAKPPDLVDGALRDVLGVAFQQLHKSHQAFLNVAAGAESEIPWKRLGPVLRSFARAVSLGEPLVTSFAVRSVDEFLDTQTTASEMAEYVGLAFGAVTLVLAGLILTGGASAAPTVATLSAWAKAAGVAALLADGVGFGLQAAEERESEILNRYALVDKAMEEFREGTLGSDLFAYFIFMSLGNMVARSFGRLLTAKAGAKGAKEIRKYSREVLTKLETKKVSRVAIRSDGESSAAAERLAGKPYRATKDKAKPTKLYTLQQEAIAREGLEPMRHVPADAVPELTKELSKAKAKLDPSVVEIAEQLDVNVVDVVDQAKKLGVEPHVMILHTARFRVKAIRQFVQVRSELLRIQRELGEVAKARKALDKKVHPRKKNQPPEVVEERARLQAMKDALLKEKDEAMKWWQAAKLTRNYQGMGDWHELWLSTANPHYTLAVTRYNPAFDAINEITNGLVSAKSVRVDEIAAASMKKSKEVGVAAGKSSIDKAIKLFDDGLDDALAKWHEQFPAKDLPQNIELRPREIELAFLVSEPSEEIQAATARDLRAYLADKTAEGTAKYTLKVRYLSHNELMGLNAASEIDQLRGIPWPNPIAGVKPLPSEKQPKGEPRAEETREPPETAVEPAVEEGTKPASGSSH